MGRSSPLLRTGSQFQGRRRPHSLDVTDLAKRFEEVYIFDGSIREVKLLEVPWSQGCLTFDESTGLLSFEPEELVQGHADQAFLKLRFDNITKTEG